MQFQMQQKYQLSIQVTDDMNLFEFNQTYKLFVQFIKQEEEEMKKLERSNQNKMTLTQSNPPPFLNNIGKGF